MFSFFVCLLAMCIFPRPCLFFVHVQAAPFSLFTYTVMLGKAKKERQVH